MNFIRTLIDLCSGFSIFKRLEDVSWFRIILHSLMMVILSTLLLTIGGYVNSLSTISNVTRGLFQELGGFRADDAALSVVKDPEKNRDFLLIPGQLQLMYRPNSLLTKSELDSAKKGVVVVWFQNGVALWWAETPGGSLYRALFLNPRQVAAIMELFAVPAFEQKAQPVEIASGDLAHETSSNSIKLTRYEELVDLQTRVQNSLNPQHAEFGRVTAGGMSGEQVLTFVNDHLKRVAEIKIKGNFPKGQSVLLDNPSILISVIVFNLITASLILYFLVVAAFLVMYGVFFMLLQYFRLSTLPKKISFRNAVAVMCYAAFPPMLVTSLFCAFAISPFHYQLMFFITFFLYQTIAFNVLIRHVNPPPPREEEHFDDEF